MLGRSAVHLQKRSLAKWWEEKLGCWTLLAISCKPTRKSCVTWKVTFPKAEIFSPYSLRSKSRPQGLKSWRLDPRRWETKEEIRLRKKDKLFSAFLRTVGPWIIPSYPRLLFHTVSRPDVVKEKVGGMKRLQKWSLEWTRSHSHTASFEILHHKWSKKKKKAIQLVSF